MPNWCINSISGPSKVLKELLSKDDKGEDYLDFNKVVPMPAHQPDPKKPNHFIAEGAISTDDANGNNWYQWSIANWGCKWNANTNYFDVDNEDGYICFDTAWSPPELWLKALSKKYPDVKFRMEYDECGMCFRGYYIAENGKVIDHDQSWHYMVGEELTCPVCNCEVMYTEDGDDTQVTKRCEECEHEVILNREGGIIKNEEEEQTDGKET